MPEGPEVKLCSEELHQAMAGKYITSIKLGERAKHKDMDKIKVGTLINRVFSKGKKIIFELSYKEQYSYICSSLLMEGHWGWDDSLVHIQLSISYGRKVNDISMIPVTLVAIYCIKTKTS
jgi:formamidopyrimidine-DNA glycosylase